MLFELETVYIQLSQEWADVNSVQHGTASKYISVQKHNVLKSVIYKTNHNNNYKKKKHPSYRKNLTVSVPRDSRRIPNSIMDRNCLQLAAEIPSSFVFSFQL